MITINDNGRIIGILIIITSMVILSSHFPLIHRSNPSMPINQSGEGTILEISET
jgi:hypothetical protein